MSPDHVQQARPSAQDLVGQGGHVGAGRGMSLEREDGADWLTISQDLTARGLSGWPWSPPTPTRGLVAVTARRRRVRTRSRWGGWQLVRTRLLRFLRTNCGPR